MRIKNVHYYYYYYYYYKGAIMLLRVFKLHAHTVHTETIR